ncbi:hypothetical protein N7539_003874 [Penicillium diatomitis]|uniref:Uncharacterized protein n=1 Tax=Penicillium diatomitis TaxID=2819901 RepID=A0A9X0BXZ6_9EURO|nr:uncharacterized protein N7539_003874 [Penicillium diatomitis]KAJ5488984.1 hypothetical protein N7539_003874 [Penicillium diatomitis]
MSPQIITINYTPENRLSLQDATTKQPLGSFRLLREGDRQVLVKFCNEAFSNERVGSSMGEKVQGIVRRPSTTGSWNELGDVEDEARHKVVHWYDQVS